MEIVDRHIAILVDNYFEQSELEGPLTFLKENGADITVVSASTKDLQALNHVNKGESFIADKLLKDVDTTSFDGLILPGGAFNSDSLRTNRKAQEWVNEFMDHYKMIAAICHAPWLLVSADVVEGRRLTSFPTLQDDIVNAGGEWIDQPVTIDANLITSRRPDDIPAFNAAIHQWLETAKII